MRNVGANDVIGAVVVPVAKVVERLDALEVQIEDAHEVGGRQSVDNRQPLAGDHDFELHVFRTSYHLFLEPGLETRPSMVPAK